MLSKRLTFTGAYAGFAKLLAALEAIEPVIRLDEVRIYERPRIPDVLWLSLVVTPMYQEGKGSKSPMPRALELPEVEIDRNPFAFADSERPAPLQAVVVPSAAAPLPTLTGIIWDSGDPIAVFTDHLQRAHLAHRNEVVVDAKVVDIQPRHVVLEYEGEQHTLSLLDEPPSDRSPGATLPNAPTSVRANLLGRRSRD